MPTDTAIDLASTLMFSREEVACRLLDSSVTDDDKDFLRSQQVRATSKSYHFQNSSRLRKLMVREPLRSPHAKQ